MGYVKRGWKVFPCHSFSEEGRCSCGDGGCGSPGKHPRTEHGHQDATTDEANINDWFSRWPAANLGVATGAISGFDVLDVDPRHGGDDSIKDLEAEHGALPDTAEQLTGGGGRHILFRHHDGVRNKAGAGSGLPPGLDVRGDGGYIIVPPSKHVSGRPYCWEVSSQPGEVPLADWPAWLLERVIGIKDAVPATVVDGAIPEGGRNETLTSLAGTMRRRGMGEAGIRAALLEENKRCVPPLAEDDLCKIAASVARYEPAQVPVLELIVTSSSSLSGPSAQERLLPATDMGNALRLVRRHGEDIRYCGVLGGWFLWDACRWRRDEAGQIIELAKDTVKNIAVEADSISEENTRKIYIKHTAQSQSHRAIKAMVDLALSDSKVCVEPDVFDQRPMLLNLKNGTLNLETGTLQPHDHGDMLTQLAGVEYDPVATCPGWQSFVSSIMDGRADLAQFIRRMAGYALTGSTVEQAFFILYGNGCNGKSTYLETLQKMMGDYAQTAEATTFLENRYEGIRNDLAALRGARLVLASETGPRKSLNETLIKQVTGNEAITARFLHKEFFSYHPWYKILLATNDKPRVHGTDRGIWRRIRLVPFTVNFEGREDKQLSQKLEQELPGILNWAVAGCMDWQKAGLAPPTEVEAATQAYREEMDVLADFIDERCVVGIGEMATKSVLYQAYVDWTQTAKERPYNKISFGRMLTHKVEHIAEGRLPGGTRCWRGIGLNSGSKPLAMITEAENSPYDV